MSEERIFFPSRRTSPPASSGFTTAWPSGSGSIRRRVRISRRKLTGGHITYGPPHTITISANLSPRDRVETLLHEAAHAFCFRRSGPDEAHSTRFWKVARAFGAQAPARARDRRADRIPEETRNRLRLRELPRAVSADPAVSPRDALRRVPRQRPAGAAAKASAEMTGHRRGVVMVAGAAILWSTGGLAIKFLPLPPLAIVFHRAWIASLMLLVLLRPARIRLNATFLPPRRRLRGHDHHLRASPRNGPPPRTRSFCRTRESSGCSSSRR